MITTPNREYMMTAAKWGRFHMISRPRIFIRGLLSRVRRIFLSEHPGAAQDKYKRIRYGRLDILSGELLRAEWERSCARLQVPDPGAPGSPGSRGPFPQIPAFEGRCRGAGPGRG